MNHQSPVNIKRQKHFIIRKKRKQSKKMCILYNKKTTCGYKNFIILLLSENKIYIAMRIILHVHTPMEKTSNRNRINQRRVESNLVNLDNIP